MTKDVLKIIGDAIKIEDVFLSQRPYDVYHRGARDYQVNLLKAVRISSVFKGGEVPDSTLRALMGIKLREIQETLVLFPESGYHKGALYGINKVLKDYIDFLESQEERPGLPGRHREPPF